MIITRRVFHLIGLMTLLSAWRHGAPLGRLLIDDNGVTSFSDFNNAQPFKDEVGNFTN